MNPLGSTFNPVLLEGSDLLKLASLIAVFGFAFLNIYTFLPNTFIELVKCLSNNKIDINEFNRK